MRFTRAGLGLGTSVVVCFILGRIFGTNELLYLAAMQLGVLVPAALLTAVTPLKMGVSRTATPNPLRVGNPARIDVVITNRGRRSTPVLLATDHLNQLPSTVLHLAPIRPETGSSIVYRLPTDRRGLVNVGPLQLRFGDPLGLTTTQVEVGAVTRLVIHPELIDLGVLQAVAGHDPNAELQPVRALASGGDEFFALRPYVVGDEMRRVHWRASARTDDLVVRQVERPRTGRVTVVLDTRREAYDDTAFDRAVSAAISVLYAAWRGGDALRYGTSAAHTMTDVRTRHDLDTIDEQLATLAPSVSASLVRSVENLNRGGRGGTLIIIGGSNDNHLALALERARRRFGMVIPVLCGANANTTTEERAIIHDGMTPLATAWRQAGLVRGS